MLKYISWIRIGIHSDSTGTIDPTATGSFNGGRWTGYVTIGQVSSDVLITAEGNGFTGDSNSFDVVEMRECPCSIWDDTATPVAPNDNDGWFARLIAQKVRYGNAVYRPSGEL